MSTQLYCEFRFGGEDIDHYGDSVSLVVILGRPIRFNNDIALPDGFCYCGSFDSESDTL